MGGCWHLSERPGYKWGVSPQQQHSFPFSSWKHNLSFDFTDPLHRPTSDRMQAPNRPVGLYGYSVRNYAPATMYSQYPASQCANSTKSPPGKSFTIDALLAKTEDTSSCRSSLTQCADKCYPAAPFVPLTGHLAITAAAPTAPYLCSPTMLHSASHMQSGYSLYCCPPFSYQPPCRGALYAQGKTTIQAAQLTREINVVCAGLNTWLCVSLQRLCPKSTQECILSKPKQESRNGYAPASPVSSCPGWRRSSPGSSTWWVQRGSCWPRLCSSLKLR